MDVRNCRKCGKLYNYVGGNFICPMCKEEAEKKFFEVRKYVQDHVRTGIQEVAEACEVEISTIQQWIREERLEFSEDSAIGLACELCGKTIRTGRYCDSCKSKTAKNLGSAMAKPGQLVRNEDKVKGKENKMRFLTRE